MNPPSNEVDQFGFPIPPTFDGQRSGSKGASRVGRLLWRWGLVLVFLSLLVGALVQTPLVDKAVDRGKGMMAGLLTTRAQKKMQLDDLSGARADLDRAASWAPDDPMVYFLRALVRLETDDVQGSLEDYDRLIRLAPQFADAYAGRSMALQRLNRHREAIDDLTRAVELSSEFDPTPLNNRAYARAVAGVELDEGLQDVQRALELVEGRITNGMDPTAQAQAEGKKSAYLDTRGYLFFLRGQYDAALADLDEAIRLEGKSGRHILGLPQIKHDPTAFARLKQSHDESLAVMYHHRGQVHEKLGNAQQAQKDLRRGDYLGYDPAAGVF